jgi:hypothetical protein
VAALPTEDGGMTVLAYNWETGNLERNFDYAVRVVLPDTEVREVDKDGFDRHVEKLRAKLLWTR